MNKNSANCADVYPMFKQTLIVPNIQLPNFKAKIQSYTSVYNTIKTVDFLRPSHENIKGNAAVWRFGIYTGQ